MQAAAWIRYFFQVDPYALDDEDFVLHWREAQFILESTKPIKKDEKSFK